MSESNDKNAFVYLLAGFGLGAIVGAAAGMLFAPKEGRELRDDIQGKAKELGGKAKELKEKTSEWVNEQKAKRKTLMAGIEDTVDEMGA